MTGNTGIFKKLLEDSDFRASFMQNPGKVFKEAGIEFFQGKEIRVYENDALNLHFTLLAKGSDLKALESMDRRFISLQEKVWEDDAFRKKLLANPKAVVSEVFGNIPEKLAIHMHENTGNIINLILPALSANQELSDTDLEQVAGGKGDPFQVMGDIYDSIPSGVKDVASTIGKGAMWVLEGDVLDSVPKPSFTFLNGW